MVYLLKHIPVVFDFCFTSQFALSMNKITSKLRQLTDGVRYFN